MLLQKLHTHVVFHCAVHHSDFRIIKVFIYFDVCSNVIKLTYFVISEYADLVSKSAALLVTT